jgi:hypothetical protein
MGTEDIVWGPHFVTDAERNKIEAVKTALKDPDRPQVTPPEVFPPGKTPEAPKKADPVLGKKI